MKLAVSTKRLEFAGKPAPQLVDGLLVIAGRLDFDHLTNGLNDCALSFLKIGKPRGDVHSGCTTDSSWFLAANLFLHETWLRQAKCRSATVVNCRNDRDKLVVPHTV